MTNEQREDVDKLRERFEPDKFGGICALGYKNKYCFGKSDLQAIDTVLSLIKEQQAEMEDLKNKSVLIKRYFKKCDLIKQKDKQIDLMAKFIENNMSEKKIINEICIKSKCNNEECHEDDLKDCIKQYFERKVEDVKD